MSANEETQPILRSQLTTHTTQSRVRTWWNTRSRDAVSFLTILLMLGAALGIWVYGTLPTADSDSHPYEYALHTPRITAHLNALFDIAKAHNNSRSVTNGHNASAQYVISQLQKADICDVHIQRFRSPVWTVHGTPELALASAHDARIDFLFGHDFQVMRYGGRGAQIKNAQMVDIPDGCSAATSVSGKIAVVERRSNCTLFDAAIALERLGALGVVFVRDSRFTAPSNARVRAVDWKEGDALMTVPVISVTHSVGQTLRALNATLDVQADTSIDVVETFNVVCVGRAGSAANTMVVGAHLDSVAAGPGINDNGSGAASTLEILITLADLGYRPVNRLVFAWWGAEEDGLLGSRHFVRVANGWSNEWSPAEELGVEWSEIALDLNFDMLASPNYIALVHNGTDAPGVAQNGSRRIQRVFEDYFVRHSYSYQITDMRGGSDFLPFVLNGVPAGGVLTGAGEIKSIEERRAHGGLANAALDTCYHRDCDGILNINIEALDKMSKAAMYAVTALASKPDLRGFLNGETEF